MNKLFIQENGLVMAFTALVLPVILLIGALMVDGGQLYIRHGEIEHLSRQSGQSGLLELAEIIKDQATLNYQSQCGVVIPPPICSSTNQFDFLTSTEINNLILNTINQNSVTQNALNFGTQFDPRTRLSSDEITITFPYLYTPGQTQVRILVEIETLPDLLLGTLLTNTQPIAYQSIAYLALQ